MNYELVSNLKLTSDNEGMCCTQTIAGHNYNTNCKSKLNHPKGYHVINHEYRIITRGWNACFLVDPIQILKMHTTSLRMKGVPESGGFNVGSIGSVSPGQGPLDNEQPGLLGVL